MLGLHRLNAIFGAAPVQGTEKQLVDPQNMVSYMRQLTARIDRSGCGLHLLFCHPGTDTPWDLRTPKVVAEAFSDWESLDASQRAISKHSLTAEAMATTTSVTLTAWLKKALKTTGAAEDLKCGPVDGVPNIACNIGASRVVVVDAPCAQAVAEFKQWAAHLSGDQMWCDPFQQMTVNTPEGGGQFWFTLPGDGSQDTDPLFTYTTTPGHLRVSGGETSFTILIHSTHVLIPGSQTQQGVWHLAGEALDAPEWLTRFIHTESAARLAGAQDRFTRLSRFGNAVATWSTTVSWKDIVSRAGWKAEPYPDRCGCPVFAQKEQFHFTGHEPGCFVEPSGGAGDAGARFWMKPPSDTAVAALCNALHRDTLTRFELAAALYCDGDLHAAVGASWNTPELLCGRTPLPTNNTDSATSPKTLWAPVGTVTTLTEASALEKIDVEIVEVGPGTPHLLDTQEASWVSLAEHVASHDIDLVLVPRFTELAGSLGIDAGTAAQWLLTNLESLSTGVNVAVAVIREPSGA